MRDAMVTSSGFAGLRARPEIVAATLVEALLHDGFKPHLERTDGGDIRVHVERFDPPGGKLGFIRVLKSGALYELDGDFADRGAMAPVLARLFDPSSPRATLMQLRRLQLRQHVAIGLHPSKGHLFGVKRTAQDKLPTWTVRRVGLLAALLDTHAPMALDAFEAVCLELQGGGGPDLDGYHSSELRWRWADLVNHEIRTRRLHFRAHPGGAGDVERVPIHAGVGAALEPMPSWRIHRTVLLPTLRALPLDCDQRTFADVMDRIAGDGAMDLADWRPGA